MKNFFQQLWKRKWVKRLSIAGISIVAILFVLSQLITYLINNELPEIIEEKNDTPYNLTYESLRFSLMDSSLSLREVSVSPKDSTQIKDSIKATGKVAKIDVVGINFFKLLAQKEVSAYSINIHEPIVNYYLPDRNKEPKDTTEVQVGKSLNISKINVKKGEFNLFSSDGKQHLAQVLGIDIGFQGVKFSERTVDKKIPFRFSDFQIKVNDLFFIVNDNQMIRSEKVKLNPTDFELNNFTMKPLKMKGKKYVPNQSSNDLLDIESPLLRLSNMDWGFTLEDKLYFKTDLIKFSQPEITILTADDKPKKDNAANIENVKRKANETELITIKQLQIEKGKIRSLLSNAETVKYSISNVDLNIEGIKLNELTRTNQIPIDYNTFKIKLDSMYYRLDEMHTIRASDLDLTNKNLVLKNFKMKPLISKNQFNKNHTAANTLLDIEAPILRLTNNRWGFLQNQFFFKTESIKLDEVKVRIIDQKNQQAIARKIDETTQKFLINFNLQVDTIAVNRSRFVSEGKFDFNRVNLKVLGLKNDYGKQLGIDHVIFNKPVFTIFGQPRRVAQRQGQTNQQFNDYIRVKKLSLLNGELSVIPYKKKEPNLRLKDIQLRFNDIEVDPKTIQDPIPFAYKNVLLRSSSLDFDMSSVYHLTTGNLEFNNGNLQVNKVAMKPKLSRKNFNAQLKVQSDLYTVSVDKVSGNGIKWGISQQNDFYLNSAFMKLDRMHANIYRSLVPPDDLRKKTMFSQKLREMKFGLGINKLQIANSVLEYEEETAKSIGTGKLTFSNIQTTINNVNSGYKKRTLPDVVVNWRSQFMNGDLQAKWSFNPMNRAEKFNIQGSISQLPAKNLDPFLVPYLKASAEGKFNKITFNFNGNDKVASGDFGIHYQNLKVSLLRDDGSKRKFLSAIGNIAVKKDSRGEMKNEKVENIVRKQDKSFFNFFLACILDGLKQTLLIV